MNESGCGARRALVIRVHERLCALPLAIVVETMRPLPCEPIPRAPSFVRGVSLVRGVPSPVVDLGAVLGAPGGPWNRFVTIRLGKRQVVLSVDVVVGIRALDDSTIQKLPPLVQGASRDIVEEIGALDEQLLLVLRQGWQLPEEVWQALA